MSDPSLTENNVGPLVLGQSYSLSNLFSFDPGTPPPGDGFLGAFISFDANPNVTFSGMEEVKFGTYDFYRWVISGPSTSLRGNPGSFSLYSWLPHRICLRRPCRLQFQFWISDI